MKTRIVLLITLWMLAFSPGSWGEGTARHPFPDEPEAHRAYDAMLKAFRECKSLHYAVFFRWDSNGKALSSASYRIWMKKPNYARVEGTESKGLMTSVLVGDGESFWIYWPGKRPFWSCEDKEDYDRTSEKRYMKQPSPAGRHSLGHSIGDMGIGIPIAIFDPSTFYGYVDSLQIHMDGVRSCGNEEVRGEDCRHIEVSYLKGQRVQSYWISEKNGLPLKISQVLYVRNTLHPV